jgi:hypothetical protein
MCFFKFDVPIVVQIFQSFSSYVTYVYVDGLKLAESRGTWAVS